MQRRKPRRPALPERDPERVENRRTRKVGLRLLGGVDVRGADGVVVTTLLAQPKRLALLAFLLLGKPRGFHTRESLVELFWPNVDSAHGRGSLRRSLHALRRSIGSEIVVSRGQNVGVNQSLIRCDVLELERMLAANQAAEALALYRGDFWDSTAVKDAVGFDQWADGIRTSLRSRVARAARGLMRRYSTSGQWVLAAEAARRAIALEPDDDTAKELLHLTRREESRDAGVHRSEVLAGVSVAVLPFKRSRGNPEEQFLLDGLVSQLIEDLTRRPELRVIAQGSITRFRDFQGSPVVAGRALGAQYVVEGHLEGDGASAVLSFALSEVADGVTHWRGRIPEPFGSLLETQERIYAGVCGVLLRTDENMLPRTRAISDPRAYECYLKARHATWHFNDKDIGRALEMLDEALRIIGDHALLYAAVGTAHVMRLYSGASSDAALLLKADDAARRGAELDPTCAPIHFLLGMLAKLRGSQCDAVCHFRRAIELDPRNPDALIRLSDTYVLLGLTGSARPLVGMLLAIDPLTGQNYAEAGFLAIAEGRLADAVPLYRRAYQLDPHPASTFCYATTLARAGGIVEAVRVFDELVASQPANILVTQLATIYRHALTGQQRRALAAVTDVLESAAQIEYLSWEVAVCFALLKQPLKAVGWLRRAAQRGFVNHVLFAEIDPHLAPLRSVPAFRSLMQDVRRQAATLRV